MGEISFFFFREWAVPLTFSRTKFKLIRVARSMVDSKQVPCLHSADTHSHAKHFPNKVLSPWGDTFNNEHRSWVLVPRVSVPTDPWKSMREQLSEQLCLSITLMRAYLWIWCISMCHRQTCMQSNAVSILCGTHNYSFMCAPPKFYDGDSWKMQQARTDAGFKLVFLSSFWHSQQLIAFKVDFSFPVSSNGSATSLKPECNICQNNLADKVSQESPTIRNVAFKILKFSIKDGKKSFSSFLFFPLFPITSLRFMIKTGIIPDYHGESLIYAVVSVLKSDY